MNSNDNDSGKRDDRDIMMRVLTGQHSLSRGLKSATKGAESCRTGVAVAQQRGGAGKRCSCHQPKTKIPLEGSDSAVSGVTNDSTMSIS